MTVERARGTNWQRQDGQGRVVETDGGRNEKTRGKFLWRLTSSPAQREIHGEEMDEEGMDEEELDEEELDEEEVG